MKRSRFILRPFGISDGNFFQFFYISAGYGFITFILFVINNFSIKTFLYKISDKNWNIGLEILYVIILFPQISLLNFLFYHLTDPDEVIYLSDFLKIAIYTGEILAILLIIRIIYILASIYRRESIILRTKNEYFNELDKFRSLFDESKECIPFELENDKFNLQRDSIVFISAWGNYIKFYIYIDNSMVQIIKRGKLKNIEMALNSYKEFYRCHRSFIINIKFLKNIKGNKKTSYAILHGYDSMIPISRDQIDEIRKLFEKIKVLR